MGESKGVYLSDQQLRVTREMVEEGEADNRSEALNNLINEGMLSYGYRAGTNGNTALKRASKELARLFTYAGVAWLVFFWAYPVGFAVPGMMALFAALAMIGCYIALDRYEPAVSHYLFGERDVA